jgi:hypothetical protein
VDTGSREENAAERKTGGERPAANREPGMQDQVNESIGDREMPVFAGQYPEFMATCGDARAGGYASTFGPARFTLIANLAISGLLTWPVFFYFLRPAVLRLKELCYA